VYLKERVADYENQPKQLTILFLPCQITIPIIEVGNVQFRSGVERTLEDLDAAGASYLDIPTQ
jgi:hypothetical protein